MSNTMTAGLANFNIRK